jgi:hypothetical protein
MGRAFEHILHGSAIRLLEAGILLGLTFAVAWVGVASLGRAATLDALQNYFSEQFPTRGAEKCWRLRSLVGLNCFRAAVTLAAAVGCWGAVVLGGAVSSAKDPSPGSAVLIFFAIVMLVTVAWLVVNWFLALASVLVVAEGEDSFGALAAAADLCRRRIGPVVAAGSWFGLAHFVAFFIATSAVAFPLAFADVLPGGVVLGGVLLVSLLYLAVADFLYIGRLAAYFCIAESPEDAAVPVTVAPGPPRELPSRPLSSSGRIDADELILSDLPVPVTP